MSVIFKSYPTMDYMLNSPSGMVGKHIARRGRIVMMAAKRQVGVKTGMLRQSIHMRHGVDGRGQYVKVGSNRDYALMHHEGTRPHVITPNTAKVLRFTAGTRVVYTRKVAHPGTRPNRYLKDNLYLAII